MAAGCAIVLLIVLASMLDARAAGRDAGRPFDFQTGSQEATTRGVAFLIRNSDDTVVTHAPDRLKARAEVFGPLAHLDLSYSFRVPDGRASAAASARSNPTPTTGPQAAFRFPAPAFLSDVADIEVTIGDRTYTSVATQGHTGHMIAALHRENHGTWFLDHAAIDDHIGIGLPDLQAGKEIIVRIRLSGLLPVADGHHVLAIPLQPDALRAGHQQPHVDLEVVLDVDLPFAGSIGPGDTAPRLQDEPLDGLVRPAGSTFERRMDGRYRIAFDGALPAPRSSGDTAKTVTRTHTQNKHELAVSWPAASAIAPRATAWSETIGDDTYLLSLVSPSRALPATSDRSLPSSTIFVVAADGSTTRDGVQHVARELRSALKGLTNDTPVAIYFAGGDAFTLFDGMQPAGNIFSASFENALHHLQNQEASKLVPALAQAFSMSGGMKSPPHIIIVNAARPGDLNEALGLAAAEIARQPGLRIHVHDYSGGAGATSQPLFARLAEIGRGRFQHATSVRAADPIGEAARVKAAATGNGLAANLPEAPDARDLRATYPGSTRAEQFPAVLPDLSRNAPVVFIARLSSAKGSVTLSGHREAGTWSQEVALAQARPASGLADLWRRQKIASLAARLQLNGTEVDQATAIEIGQFAGSPARGAAGAALVLLNSDTRATAYDGQMEDYHAGVNSTAAILPVVMTAEGRAAAQRINYAWTSSSQRDALKHDLIRAVLQDSQTAGSQKAEPKGKMTSLDTGPGWSGGTGPMSSHPLPATYRRDDSYGSIADSAHHGTQLEAPGVLPKQGLGTTFAVIASLFIGMVALVSAFWRQLTPSGPGKVRRLHFPGQKRATGSSLRARLSTTAKPV